LRIIIEKILHCVQNDKAVRKASLRPRRMTKDFVQNDKRLRSEWQCGVQSFATLTQNDSGYNRSVSRRPHS